MKIVLVRGWLRWPSWRLGNAASAQDSFFKGKTVRIIVPFAAGGGYDIDSRIMGQHMGKYIQGNPLFVVATNAGGSIGLNFVYKAISGRPHPRHAKGKGRDLAQSIHGHHERP